MYYKYKYKIKQEMYYIFLKHSHDLVSLLSRIHACKHTQYYVNNVKMKKLKQKKKKKKKKKEQTGPYSPSFKGGPFPA